MYQHTVLQQTFKNNDKKYNVVIHKPVTWSFIIIKYYALYIIVCTTLLYD